MTDMGKDPELVDEQYHEMMEALLPRDVVVELKLESGETF